ncbi:MAG: hypothetical protein F6J93_34300 [Oscillatoria sp. SIO1A7]|nr:hypothetical protein [Oscillatoria sp. SIO1A7]
MSNKSNPNGSFKIIGKSNDLNISANLFSFLNELSDLKKLSVEGELAVSFSFESHPKSAVVFKAPAGCRAEVVKNLSPGIEIRLFEVGFRVSSLKIVEIKLSDLLSPSIEVTLELQGKHEAWISQKVPLLDSDRDRSLSETCPKEGSSTEAIARKSKIYLTKIAKKAGGNYLGPPVSVEIDDSANASETTDFLSESNQKIRYAGNTKYGYFLDYCQINGVKAKKWLGTPIRTVLEWEIISNIESTYAGYRKRDSDASISFMPVNLDLRDENTSNIIPSSIIWPYKKVVGDFLTEKSENNFQQEDAEDAQRQREKTIVFEGYNDPKQPPEGKIRDVTVSSSNAYDRHKTIRTFLDGLPVEEEAVTYGIVGLLGINATDSENKWTAPSISDWWGIKKKSTKAYIYDGEGRQIGYSENGYEMLPLLRESQQLETVRLTKEIANAGGEEKTRLEQKLQAYFWKKVSFIKQHGVKAEPYFRYYTGSEGTGDRYLPPWEIEKRCLPDGSVEYFDASNSQLKFSEPYFVSQEATRMQGLIFAPNPDYLPGNEDADPAQPFLTAGEESWSWSKINILPSKNTYNSQYLQSQSRYEQSNAPDRFVRQETRQVSKGPNDFQDRFKETNFSLSSGRPNPIPQMPPLWKTSKEDFNGSSDKDIEETTIVIVKTANKPSVKVEGGEDFVEGTVNYEGAKTLREVERGLLTDLSIDNTSALQENLTVRGARFNWRPGDRLVYFVSGERRQRVIKNISFAIQFLGSVNNSPVIVESGTKLEVGAIIPSKLQFKTRRQSSNDRNLTGEIARQFIRRNTEIGQLPELPGVNRLNF